MHEINILVPTVTFPKLNPQFFSSEFDSLPIESIYSPWIGQQGVIFPDAIRAISGVLIRQVPSSCV